jgi:putative flippase GtrA
MSNQLPRLNINGPHRLGELWRLDYVRFVVVGIGNTAFGYGVYLLALWLGIPYQAAAVLSTILGVIFNFFTTGRIVFRNSSMSKIIGFFMVYAVVLAVNLVLLTALVEAGTDKALGQMFVLPIVVVLSYLLNKYLVFRKSA